MKALRDKKKRVEKKLVEVRKKDSCDGYKGSVRWENVRYAWRTGGARSRAGNRPFDKANARDVGVWWSRAYKRFISYDAIVPACNSGKNNRLFKSLLESYGGELVCAVIVEFMKSFDMFVGMNGSWLSVGAKPSVGLFYSMREQFFLEFQDSGCICVESKQVDPSTVGEYRESPVVDGESDEQDEQDEEGTILGW